MENSKAIIHGLANATEPYNHKQVPECWLVYCLLLFYFLFLFCCSLVLTSLEKSIMTIDIDRPVDNALLLIVGKQSRSTEELHIRSFWSVYEKINKIDFLIDVSTMFSCGELWSIIFASCLYKTVTSGHKSMILIEIDWPIGGSTSREVYPTVIIFVRCPLLAVISEHKSMISIDIDWPFDVVHKS